MNKNTVIGLLLIGAIFFGFTWYSSKQSRERARLSHIEDSIARANAPATVVVPDSQGNQGQPDSPGGAQQLTATQANDSARVQQYGAQLVERLEGEEKFYTVENDLLKLTLSNRGGRAVAVELKEYKKYGGGPLQLIAEGSARFNIGFFVQREGRSVEINTADYVFDVEEPVQSEDAQIVRMRLPVDGEACLEYVYTVRPGQYMVDYSVNFVGMGAMMSNQSEFTVDWRNDSPQNEHGFKNENKYTSVYYLYPGAKSPESLSVGDGQKREQTDGKVRWVAFKQQFFSSALIAGRSGDRKEGAQTAFQGAELSYATYPDGSGKVKDFNATLSVPFNSNVSAYDFSFYYGPNKYSVLKKYGMELRRLVPLGGAIIRFVNVWIVIPVFDFLGSFISNFGLIILLLTIFIKLITLPLTYRSYRSQAKMRLLKPEIDELAKKFPKPEDALKKQQATMELYKRAGANPMGGCIPMLIQFPVLIAMFYFFPASIELRGESFMWASDLSSYDSILTLPFTIPFYGSHVSLFALLMAVSVFLSSKMSYNQTSAAGPQMAGMKFMMLYIMPIMMLLWFNDYASGLSCYYFLSNLITIGQTYAFRYAVDEKKLHEAMKANAKKPRKKSKWQQRYEEMLKAQQQQARKR
ncbi:MAG: membrane protein insertase YidC [Rikenellaceae bacterium]|jgi:YidC/Oxa1 family membrane protein insertase|nr:membrane protein insertase YidC [Rikenellaceae bacterium]